MWSAERTTLHLLEVLAQQSVHMDRHSGTEPVEPRA
jgi:hypothetical protein